MRTEKEINFRIEQINEQLLINSQGPHEHISHKELKEWSDELNIEVQSLIWVLSNSKDDLPF